MRPTVIGHRGASGYVPEHTLTSYFIAIQQGADYAEPDLVMTRDGVLVARHENEIGGTTNVAEHPEFAARHTKKRIDGVEIEGWFTEDFTLAELKTLRARERIPDIRPENTRFDGMFEIPTFDEILGLIGALNTHRPIGVYPETKHPSYFEGIGLSMDGPLLQALTRHGYKGSNARVFIQSFEVANLKRLRKQTPVPIVQLIEATGAPYDFTAAKDSRTYADMIRPKGLAEVATYANAIGPSKLLIIPRDSANNLGSPTTLVADAHAAGLKVHPWTFRADNHFLPANCRKGPDEHGLGDLTSELKAYLATGIDGFFTDHSILGVRALTEPLLVLTP
jgi:glycerophosphoryl diester phosphodiesterase